MKSKSKQIIFDDNDDKKGDYIFNFQSLNSAGNGKG